MTRWKGKCFVAKQLYTERAWFELRMPLGELCFKRGEKQIFGEGISTVADDIELALDGTANERSLG
jgi:hypothetical protein